MSEKSALMGGGGSFGGGEVLPPRLNSGETMRRIEIYVFVAVVCLGIAAGVISGVYTISHDPALLTCTIAVGLMLALMCLVGRSYYKDDLQDRQIVYLLLLTAAMVFVSAIVVSVRWVPCGSPPPPPPPPSDPFQGCSPSSFFSPLIRDTRAQKGTCLSFVRGVGYQPPAPVFSCYMMNQSSGVAWGLTPIDKTGNTYVSPSNSFGYDQALAFYNSCLKRAMVNFNISR